MVEEDILCEIDSILDKLINNAKHLADISMHSLSEKEILDHQKTQDSLLSHLLYMDNKYLKTIKKPNKKEASIQKKLKDFERLNQRFIKNVIANNSIVQFDKIKKKKKKPNKKKTTI